MNVGRVSVVAMNVFRDVIRDRVLYLTGLYAVLFVAACALMPYIAAGTENQILLDLGLSAIGVLSLLVAIFVGTGLVSKEIEKRTVFVLISKPISYSEFIVGKHLGLSAVLAVLIAIMAIVYLGVLSFYRIPYPVDSIIVATLYQFFEVSLITAIAILFGVFASPLLATLFTFSVYLMGHLSRDLLALGGIAKNQTVQHVIEGIYLLLPDLARLDLKNQAIYGIDLLPPFPDLLINAVYGWVYTIVLLAIATLIFSRRQF